jgi:hypothetical protein
LNPEAIEKAQETLSGANHPIIVLNAGGALSKDKAGHILSKMGRIGQKKFKKSTTEQSYLQAQKKT